MGFQRIQSRELPDGTIAIVYPFHICMEGMRSVLLCRDDEDYDVLQKTIHVSCHVNNVIVIEEIVMSNHCHAGVLAVSQSNADRAGEMIKKNYSQFISYKYGERGTLCGCDVKAIYIDSDSYLRNALAYIPRNALDAGKRIDEYKWSSYRGMFITNRSIGKRVSALSRREKESLFHTHANLNNVLWEIDDNGCLIPETACDHLYLEKAFYNDQAFFLRTIGSVNYAEMTQKLVSAPRERINDDEFNKYVNETVNRWFNSDLASISLNKKARIVPYLYHTRKTSVAQLARCVQLERSQVEEMLRLGTGNWRRSDE